MNRYCRIAATKLAFAAFAIFILAGVIAGRNPAIEVWDRHNEIASFTSTKWITDYPEDWEKINLWLNDQFDLSKKPDIKTKHLFPVADFSSKNTKPQYKEWQSKRYGNSKGTYVGRSDYDVNFGFAVMTHPQGEDPTSQQYKIDKEVMARVMRLPINRYEDLFKDPIDRGFYTQDLTQVVLGSKSSLQGLGVNSIYIASEKSGMAAFYPATGELGRQEATDIRSSKNNRDLTQNGKPTVYYRYYDPRTRPWHRAAFNKTDRTEKYDDDSGLSYEYLDYTEKVTLVRTAWKKFGPEGSKYIVCIDLILYGDSNSETGIVGNVSAELGGLASIAGRKALDAGLVFASPLVALSLLVLFGAFPCLTQALAIGPRRPGKSTYRFRRVRQPLYWRPEGHGVEEISNQRREILTVGNSMEGSISVTASWGTLLASLGKKLWKSTESANEAKHTIVQTIPHGPKDLTERCVEEWNLDKTTGVVRECRQCGSQVTLNIHTRTVSEMRVIHRDHENIGIELLSWKENQNGVINDQLAQEQLTAHVTVGGNVSDTFEIQPPLKKDAKVPRHIANLVDISTHLEVTRQVNEGRIGYQSGIDISFPLYGDSSVQAVADVWYLDRLIKTKQTDMLFTGTKIMRLLFAKSEKEIYNLYHLYGDEFVHIVEGAGKQLRYVTKNHLPKSFETFNKWDFAVLDYATDQACVIVTDTGQGQQRQRTEDANHFKGITGELSWRKADVEFYHQVFNLMWVKKQDPMELVEKWEKEGNPTQD